MNEVTSKYYNELISTYGSPLYVFDEQGFINNYRHLENSIKEVYPNYIPALSYKTNYMPYLCDIVRKLGGYAEVVSDMEYSIAKYVGYDDKKIIYNGPVKGPLMETHIVNGGIVNIDNIEECKRIIDIAGRNPENRLKCGIRVNIDINQGFISRFGIDADSPELGIVIEMINLVTNLRLVGLHMHVGRTRDVDAWSRRAVEMIRLADCFFKDAPEFINLGSGMFGCMEDSLAVQFSDHIPTYSDYAEAIGIPMINRYGYLPIEKQPVLFTEPGTTVDSRYMDFIARVENIKLIRGKTFITLNCSVDNIGTMCKIKKMPLDIIHNCGKLIEIQKGSFVGYTCLEDDIMYEGFSGELAVGDTVIFGNVGGYSNVTKPPFILWNCPIVAIRPNGNSIIVKEQETFDDILRTYMLPNTEEDHD